MRGGRLEPVRLGARGQPVLRHRERGLGRVRARQRVGREPGGERRLELVAEPLPVEVRELRVPALLRVDPLDERRDVDLHLPVRDRGLAVDRDAVRGGAAVAL